MKGRDRRKRAKVKREANRERDPRNPARRWGCSPLTFASVVPPVDHAGTGQPNASIARG